MFISATTLGPTRRLSMIASEASSRVAMARALSTPPASGETMVTYDMTGEGLETLDGKQE